MTEPPGPPSAALKIFQPAACALRSGFSLLASASLSFPITISKSPVLSALTKFRITPPSVLNTKGFGAAAGGCAGAACAKAVVADSVTTANPNTILRSIEASCERKGVTLPYSALHEHGHYFVSKEHSLAGQAEARSVALQAAGFEKRLEVGAKPAPDVNPVASLYGICVDPVNQPQSGKECVAKPFIGGQSALVDRHCRTLSDLDDVLRCGGNVLPADAPPRGMGTAAEPEPLAVRPVFEVMA